MGIENILFDGIQHFLPTLSKDILYDHIAIFLLDCVFPRNKFELEYIKGNSCRKSLLAVVYFGKNFLNFKHVL